MDITIQSDLTQFALAYSTVGLILAVATTIARWYFPIIAASASVGDHSAASRRIRRFYSIARGFSYFEYFLVIMGTLVESFIVFTGAADVPLHVIYLGVHALLWLMLVLNWQKRPIVGRVVTPRQQPVRGAVIRVIHNNSHLHEAAITDNHGKFHVRVYPGEYQLSVEKPDHESTQTVIKTNSNAASRVSLVVKPKLQQERMTSPLRRTESHL